jgi:BolA protein
VQPSSRVRAIENALVHGLEAVHVEVMDNSAGHANHLGAEDGGGHFVVVGVSRAFRGLSRIAAQKLVYEALAELMTEDIHALSMRTLTPEQWTADRRP